LRVVHRPGRALAALLLPLLVATCTEEPMAPRGPVGFAQLAVEANAPGAGQFAGMTIDFVQAVVTKPNPQLDKLDTLASKTIPFPPDANTINLGLTLLLSQSVDTVDLTLNYLSGIALLFTGGQRIEVRQGPAGANPVPAIPMLYVGPGANVTTLTVQPRDTILTERASFQFGVTALDGQGASVPQFYVSWTSTSAGNVINAAGALRAGTSRATFFVRAMTPDSVWDSTQVTIVPAPASVQVQSGNNQSGLVSTALPLPLVVLVRGGDNLPVPGVRVAFAAATGGGSVDTAAVITDNAGLAGTTVLLGATAGAQTFTATVPGLAAVTFTATASPVIGPASRLFIATAPSTTAASGVVLAQQPVIQVRDASNQNVSQSGIAVTAAIASGGGALAGTMVVSTDASGRAVFTDLALSGTVGPRTLVFTSPSLTPATSGTITLGAGPATTYVIQAGGIQSAVAGTAVPIPPAVLVTDNGGNGVAGVNVTFAVASGGGTVVPTTPVATLGTGIATATSWTLGATPGTNTLTATAPAVPGGPLTFTAMGTPATALLTWTGAADGDWNNPANWSGGAVPGTTDDVVIPAGTPFAPALSGSITLHSLTVSSGARLTSADYTITLGGDLDAQGAVAGCCTLAMTGAATTARGTLEDMTLTINAGAVVTLTGDLLMTRALSNPSINIGGELVVNGHTLGGTSVALATSGPGGLLTMHFETDHVIAQSATFNGGNETGHLTAGLLDVTRDFVQDTTSSPSSFAASSTHRTQVGTGSSGSISFASPGASMFQNLIVDPGDGTTRLLSSVFVLGNFQGTGIGTIQVDSFVVSILGSLNVTGPNFTSTSGGLALSGNGTVQGSLSGIFPIINGTYQLAGNVIGDTLGIVNGDLTVNGHTLDLLSLELLSVGTLTMTNPNDTVYAGDFAGFNGGSTAGRLTEGVLILLGDFVQGPGGSPSAFAPSGNHLTVFAGPGVQNVNFFNPGATASHFQNVLDSNAVGGVTVDSAFVLGTASFASTVPHTIHGLGVNSRLVLSDLDISSATFDNLGVAMPADGSGAFTQFDNVTFQNYATDGMTLLTIVHPGAAAAFNLTNLTFNTTIGTGTSNYLSATDSDGSPPLLDLRVTSNLDPVDADAHTQRVNGARVTW
jgi:hypothetical protein